MATVLVRIKADGGPRWDHPSQRWQYAGEVHQVEEDDLRLWLNHAEVLPSEPVKEVPDEPEEEPERKPRRGPRGKMVTK